MDALPIPIVAIFGLIGLMWGLWIVHRANLLGLCVLTLAVGSVLGYPFFHVSVVTLDRALLGVVCVLFALKMIQRQLPLRRLGRPDLMVGALIVALIASTLRHDWRINGAQPLATLLFFYLLPLAIYVIASRCEVTRTSYVWTLWGFALFGVYLAGTATLEVAGVHGLVFPRFIVSPEHVEFLGRGRGPFLNPVGNGMYLTAATIAAVMLWPHCVPRFRPVTVGLALTNLLGAGLTLTRSVWLGVAGALFGMLLVSVPAQHRLRCLLLAGMMGVAVLGLKGGALSRFKRDKNVSAAEMEQSAKLRPILAAYAYEIFRDHPFQGVGFGQYKQRNLEYLTRRSFNLPMEKAKTYVQHNVFLSLLAETGLIGLVLLVGVLFAWGVEAYQLWYSRELQLWQRQAGMFTAAMLVAYAANGMFHELSLIPMLNMLVFFVAGLSRGQAAEQAARQYATQISTNHRIVGVGPRLIGSR